MVQARESEADDYYWLHSKTNQFFEAIVIWTNSQQEQK